MSAVPEPRRLLAMGAGSAATGRISSPPRRSLFVVLVAIVPLLAGCLGQPAAGGLVEVVILDVSDWHGQLDPVRGIGGAATLAAYFAKERAAHPRTLTVTAGDSFGATPPLSAYFDDEPTALAMNLMGFDANTFGNHDFDHGVSRAAAIAAVARFPFLAANLHGAKEVIPGVEDGRIFDVGGVKVGIVGLVNEEAPSLTKPGSFGSLTVTDAAQAALRERDALRAGGAQVLVILAHKGVGRSATGPLVDLANNVTGFDLIIGDHTNAHYEARIGGALVIENPSKGMEYARVTLVVDRTAGRVASSRVDFVVPDGRGVEADPRVEAVLAPYRAKLAPVLDQRVATAAEEITVRSGNGSARDEPMGNLLADAMRQATGAQIALTNPGGTRSGLPTSYAPLNASLRRTEAPFDLVRGDAFVVLPFGNALVAGKITGATLWAALEHGLADAARAPEVSGVRVVFDSTRPEGSRIVSVSLDGPPLACPAATLPCDALPRGPPVLPDETRYDFVTNDYVAQGGDGYAMLVGLGPSGSLMTDALISHLARLGTVEPRVDGRMFDLRGPAGMDDLSRVPNSSATDLLRASTASTASTVSTVSTVASPEGKALLNEIP